MQCRRCKAEEELYSIKISFPYGAVNYNGLDVTMLLCENCAENFYKLCGEYIGLYWESTKVEKLSGKEGPGWR